MRCARCTRSPPPATRTHHWPDGRKLIVASEYEQLTKKWLAAKGIDAMFLRAYGATGECLLGGAGLEGRPRFCPGTSPSPSHAPRSSDAASAHPLPPSESLPPEDADIIVDNAATGSTLKANNLEVRF